ncbi:MULTISPECIES: CBS domain-containing protein [unclassified Modicisalibacter]|uniref:CBS domain-containing protein n=1 Tax=unclassified Modicisalibacter TaxID=2679913 RepID=UPI001CCE9D45|nr:MULTISPECIES: CBS domain-containing protein [unclassified Modicisalibacter]MBZ9556963.1 CBS domain-containing protein [Modicisalibacter sp. R2A 31.J]MBZ9574323.1 CBS domain-containing protein [Modicisalibacter sp. MOD 31.J]
MNTASPQIAGLALPLESLDPQVTIRRPTTVASLDVDSPARALLTDFAYTGAFTIPASHSITQALEIMKQGGVRLLFVLNAAGQLTGVVNARELIGGRRVTLAMHRHQVERSEVTVEMVQTPRQELHALPLSRLEKITVGELVKALEAFGDQHLLITEKNEQGVQCVRGLISAADVGRALGITLDRPPEARNFATICKVILGHEI